MTRVAVALIDVDLTFFPQVSRRAGTGSIKSRTFTAASVQAAHLQTWVLVDFTVSAFKLGCADTLIGIDEIPTGGVVLARGRQTLIVLLLTVQAMVAWHAKTPVAVSHAAADPVSAGVQGTEVHQLGAGGSCEPCCAATSKPQGAGALGVACPVIVTGAGGTRVHLLLTCSTLVSFGTVTPGPGQAAETSGSILAGLGDAVIDQQLATLSFITWLTGAREVASFTPLPDVSAGAVVATRSVVAGVIFLTKNPGVAVFALAEEGALRGLGDAFAFSGALRVTEAAAGLHTAAGLHRQVETERDLRGRGSANANHTQEVVLSQGKQVVWHHQSIRGLQEPHGGAVQNG